MSSEPAFCRKQRLTAETIFKNISDNNHNDFCDFKAVTAVSVYLACRSDQATPPFKARKPSAGRSEELGEFWVEVWIPCQCSNIYEPNL
ncbi:hypothetical protein ACTXT7_006417 [Hymenolepis weldensis]